MRMIAAEFVGTAFLLAVVVGSGIMGESLAGGNTAIALLANSIATGAALIALISTLGGISAHFNPLVSLVGALDGRLSWKDFGIHLVVQVLGACVGVFIAHAMFGQELISVSLHDRNTFNLYFSEGVATFGLILVIVGTLVNAPKAIAVSVGAYITAAYWFTSSTSFANPAVTIARALTNSFAGIAPKGVIGFIVAQFMGAGAAWIFSRWLFALPKESAK